MSRPAMPDSSTDASDGATRGRSLVLGIGCRRGVSLEQIEVAVWAVLADVARHDEAAHRASTYIAEHVACIATIDTKAHEPALLAFCARHALPLKVFCADEIAACLRKHPGLVQSPVVLAHASVAGVCEPCALLAAPGGRLVAAKRAYDGVTVAIADTRRQAGIAAQQFIQPPMRTP